MRRSRRDGVRGGRQTEASATPARLLDVGSTHWVNYKNEFPCRLVCDGAAPPRVGLAEIVEKRRKAADLGGAAGAAEEEYYVHYKNCAGDCSLPLPNS